MSPKYCVDCGSTLSVLRTDGVELYCHCPECGARWVLLWDDEQNYIAGFQCDNGTRARDAHDHGSRGTAAAG